MLPWPIEGRSCYESHTTCYHYPVSKKHGQSCCCCRLHSITSHSTSPLPCLTCLYCRLDCLPVHSLIPECDCLQVNPVRCGNTAIKVHHCRLLSCNSAISTGIKVMWSACKLAQSTTVMLQKTAEVCLKSWSHSGHFHTFEVYRTGREGH